MSTAAHSYLTAAELDELEELILQGAQKAMNAGQHERARALLDAKQAIQEMRTESQAKRQNQSHLN